MMNRLCALLFRLKAVLYGLHAYLHTGFVLYDEPVLLAVHRQRQQMLQQMTQQRQRAYSRS